MRNPKLIKNISNDFLKSSSQSLISCYKEEYINPLLCTKKDKLSLEAISKMHNRGIRRQDKKDLFIRNGSLYITKSKLYKKKENKLDL